MKSIEKLTVTLYFQEKEMRELEEFRSSSEEILRETYTDVQFQLSDAIQYIVGEVLSGRGKYIKIESHIFDS